MTCCSGGGQNDVIRAAVGADNAQGGLSGLEFNSKGKEDTGEKCEGATFRFSNFPYVLPGGSVSWLLCSVFGVPVSGRHRSFLFLDQMA